MSETTRTLLQEKTEGWDKEKLLMNFAADNELTVTITLKEYRDLIIEKSVNQYKNAELQNDYYTLKGKHDELIRQIEILKGMLSEKQCEEVKTEE